MQCKGRQGSKRAGLARTSKKQTKEPSAFHVVQHRPPLRPRYSESPVLTLTTSSSLMACAFSRSSISRCEHAHGGESTNRQPRGMGTAAWPTGLAVMLPRNDTADLPRGALTASTTGPVPIQSGANTHLLKGCAEAKHTLLLPRALGCVQTPTCLIAALRYRMASNRACAACSSSVITLCEARPSATLA